MPINCTGYIALNSHRGVFKRVAMRKAINWAVDRTELARQAGPAAASPWSHLLPPLFPGSIRAKRLQPYSVHANLKKAKSLAGPGVRYRKLRIGYRSSGTVFTEQAELVRQEMLRLGFRAANITMKAYPGGALYTAMGSQGSDLDMGVSLGWCADYPDSVASLSMFLGGPFGVDDATYEAKLARANKLLGAARLRALGRLDLEVTRNLAPAAVVRTYNNRYFFSSRVNPKSLSYSGAYQDWSIPALALR
jgi:ABC-type oligopeptide transport system substrate-binding subunit